MISDIAQTILRRQRASNLIHRGDEARIERLAEDADALGQNDSIETVLQVIVIAAHMDLPEGVLRDVGCL